MLRKTLFIIIRVVDDTLKSSLDRSEATLFIMIREELLSIFRDFLTLKL